MSKICSDDLWVEEIFLKGSSCPLCETSGCGNGLKGRRAFGLGGRSGGARLKVLEAMSVFS